jgi:hypothetical protein
MHNTTTFNPHSQPYEAELRLPENLQNTKKRRMNFLHVRNFPWPQTLPERIEEISKTLQTFIITNIPMLWKLPECLTRMTSLKMLHIVDFSLLDDLPSGMHRLTSLEALAINGSPKLCRKCQPHSGEYWPMISRIKRVNIGKPEE